MAENLSKVPKRGILKVSSSFEQPDQPRPSSKGQPHFDETNIKETLHPADKDYGFMRIDEPKTPYEYPSGGEDEDDEDTSLEGTSKHPDELDASLLAAKIATEGPKGPRPRKFSEPSSDPEDIAKLTPEDQERKKSFEQKRKAHYKEFENVKLARQLMEKDELDEEVEPLTEDSKSSTSTSDMDTNP